MGSPPSDAGEGLSERKNLSWQIYYVPVRILLTCPTLAYALIQSLSALPMARRLLIRHLKRAFSPDEWKWLQDEPTFTGALKTLDTQAQVENVGRIGENLIRMARERKHPGKRKPPPEPIKNGRKTG